MLCDGRMVYGCADPYGKRVLGDAKTASVADIWSGETIGSLRRGPSTRAVRRFAAIVPKLPLGRNDAPPQRSLEGRAAPVAAAHRMHGRLQHLLQSGLLCPGDRHYAHEMPACSASELFRRVIDEAGPSLVRVDFFNYGEAFLHKRALEMCEHIKTTFRRSIYTSTNGLAFNEDGARRLIRSGIDEVTFSPTARGGGNVRHLPSARRLRQGDP